MNSLTLFDYSAVSEDLRQELADDAAHINGHRARAEDSIIAIGERLLLVKEKLPHGQFLKWVEAECGYGERSVRDYMDIAREFASNRHRGADLPLRAKRLLAAPSMPEDAKKRIYERIDAGENVGVREIEDERKRALEAIRRAEEAESQLADKDAAAKRAEREAEKAKREAEAAQAKASDLLGQVNMLRENADAVRIKAEREAQEKAAEERQRLLSEIEKAKAEAERVRQEAEAAAKAQAEAAAQAELAKVEADVKEARRKEAEARAAVERLREQKDRLDAMIREQQEVAKRLSSADHEVSELLKAADEMIRQQAMFMLIVGDLEYQADHPEKLRRVIGQLADQSGKMQGVLSSLYNHRLRVVEIDAEAING